MEEFKGKLVDNVIDDIKRMHGGPVKIVYPKMAYLTNDNNPARLIINCDIHGYILSFDHG